MNKHILTLIIFLVLLSSSTAFVHASQTFTVPPFSKQVVNVNLSQGDSVNGTFSVSGGTGTGVNFGVTNPDGKELLNYSYTNFTNFSFSSSINGTYVLSFDNSFCSCYGGKTVTLDYTVNSKTVQVNSQVSFFEGSSFIPIVIAFGLIFVIAISTVAIFLKRKKHSMPQINNPKYQSVDKCGEYASS